jgi:hypothetical protein
MTKEKLVEKLYFYQAKKDAAVIYEQGKIQTKDEAVQRLIPGKRMLSRDEISKNLDNIITFFNDYSDHNACLHCCIYHLPNDTCEGCIYDTEHDNCMCNQNSTYRKIYNRIKELCNIPEVKEIIADTKESIQEYINENNEYFQGKGKVE